MFEKMKESRERRKAEKAFKEKIKRNEQEAKINDFVIVCNNERKASKDNIASLEDRIMAEFDKGDQTEARVLCTELTHERRAQQIWNVIYQRARESQVAAKTAGRMQELNVIMNNMSEIMDFAKTPANVYNLTRDWGMKQYNNVWDTILSEARQANNSSENVDTFNKMREEWAKRQSLNSQHTHNNGVNNDTTTDLYDGN